MAINATFDWDRLTDGIGTANVITGFGTRDGAANEDEGDGLAVTKVMHNMTSIAVGTGGTDIAADYGILHINPDGSYSYQRTAANIWEAGFPPAGTSEYFSYQITDEDGNVDVADLTFDVFMGVAGTYDKATRTQTGTEYDDYMTVSDAANPGLQHTDGGKGQGLIIGSGRGNHILGGAGNDWLKGEGGDGRLDGGQGWDRLEGGAGNDTASYASSKAAVIVDLMLPD